MGLLGDGSGIFGIKTKKDEFIEQVTEKAEAEQYSGEGSEYLKSGQRRKLAKWEKNPNKQWKVEKKKQDWLENQAPDYDWQKQQRADEMALQQADDIDKLRAKIAAGEIGLSDAEMRQMSEGAQTAAAQQQAAQEERVMQDALAQGRSSAQAQRMVSEFREDKGQDTAQTGAKASRDAWIADLAKKQSEQQRYEAMRAAYTAAYDESDSGAGAAIWSSLINASGGVAGLLAQLMGEDEAAQAVTGAGAGTQAQIAAQGAAATAPIGVP